MDKQLRGVRYGNATKLGIIGLYTHYVSRRCTEFMCFIFQNLNRGNKGLSTRASSNPSIVSKSET
jgi:hypothetical protein